MINLIAALAWFVFAHLAPSNLRLQDVIAGRIGAGAYAGLFSVVSIALYGPYIIGVELASMLLLPGLIGAYHLGRRVSKESR